MTLEEQLKARRRAYRDVAQIACQLPGPAGLTVSVFTDAHIHQVEGGAYVEAQIWVPDRKLETHNG